MYKARDNQTFVVSAIVGTIGALGATAASVSSAVATGAAAAGAGVGAGGAAAGFAQGAAGGAAASLTGAAGGAGLAGSLTTAIPGVSGAALGAPGVTSTATGIAGAGAAASGIGTAIGLGSQAYQIYGGMQAAEASQQAEALRKEQMQFESKQAQLRAMREQQFAMAGIESNEAASGMDVGGGGSSEGARGGAYGTFATNINQARTAERIGLDMFSANADYSQATGNIQLASGFGNFAQNAGMAAGPLFRVGASLFNPNRYSA